jgi:hypothetical protein
LIRHEAPWNNIPTHMIRAFFVSLVLTCASAGLAADELVTDFDCVSPDGRFALRMVYPKKPDDADVKLDLVEKQSGKVMVDLGTVADSRLEAVVMVWSADSKRVAYGSRDDEPGARVTSGSTVVFFWNGAAFDRVELPQNLPSPKIAYPKGAGADVKPYGGVVKPLRWLKTGELELSADELVVSRVDEKSYTGTVTFTITFDKEHVPSVKTIGKTKTVVE